MAGYNNEKITYEIKEHIGVIGSFETGRGEKWSKQVNLVSWNGNPAKIDIRDWNGDCSRMSKGITLTEEQAMQMTRLLFDRYRTRAGQNRNTDAKDAVER